MLILKKNTDGTWIKLTYRGADIELKIRPAMPDMIEKLNKKHTRFEFIKDPDSREMKKIKSLDNDAFIADMADYFLEDFKGIGFSKDEPLPVTKENKVMVATLAPLPGEQPIWDFILQKVNELRTYAEAEETAQEKN